MEGRVRSLRMTDAIGATDLLTSRPSWHKFKGVSVMSYAFAKYSASRMDVAIISEYQRRNIYEP